MTKEERKRLRELATKATPGPWLQVNSDPLTVTRGGTFYIEDYVCDVTPEFEALSNAEANMEFIAAANPAAVIDLLDEVERLREIATLFAETAEAAVFYAEYKNAGGMCVPFHGDFCSATPSTISRLRWWGKRFREVLK